MDDGPADDERGADGDSALNSVLMTVVGAGFGEV